MDKRITVFTPSYNRADLLPNLYESLLQQSCRDFRFELYLRNKDAYDALAKQNEKHE